MDAMKQLDFAAAFGSEENRRILEQEKIRLAWHRESAASPQRRALKTVLARAWRRGRGRGVGAI